MSPELNGNPPTITKRKKNREKKHSSTSVINDSTMPSYNCFQNNLNSFPNLTLQDTSSYYPFFNCPIPTEPMSLPVYPTHYQPYSYPSNPNLTYSGNITNKINFSNILPTSLSMESNDYMSLPIVTADQNDCGKRRFSDPGPNDSDSSSNSVESRIIRKLSEQINTLKECNRKLNREINDMRIELNVLKQQHSSRHFDRDYEPGMLAEFIKEVRDAARVREDALIAKVKYMIEEKQLSMVSFTFML